MQYENEVLADKTSCANIRADLKMCLLRSECCKDVRISRLQIKFQIKSRIF